MGRWQEASDFPFKNRLFFTFSPPNGLLSGYGRDAMGSACLREILAE